MTDTTASRHSRLPALFISHGSPMLGLMTAEDDEYTRALQQFVRDLPEKPEAVVIVSAHGLSPDRTIEVNASSRPRLIYDFRGFPSALYQIEYPVRGAPELAARIAALLADAGFEASLTRDGGLDHGVWIPLRAAFPDAEVPVVQITMPYPSQPERVLQLGKALAGLRDQGVLLVGSGGLVHNLGKLVWHGKNAPAAPWAEEFDDWVRERLQARDVASLCDFEDAAPHAKLAHPTTEHFYPLFFMLGASARGDDFHSIFRGIQYSSLSMSCFALMPPEAILQ